MLYIESVRCVVSGRCDILCRCDELEVTFEDVKVGSFGGLQVDIIRKILVPVDGSDCSFEAVEYAVNLAAKHNSEICLVFIVPTSASNYYLMTEDWSPVLVCTMREMEEEGESILLSTVTSVKEAGTKARAQLDYGRPAHKIVQIAKEENSDMIVMGRSSRSFVARWLFGSVSDEVVRRAPCPVLVVKERPQKPEYKEGGRTA